MIPEQVISLATVLVAITGSFLASYIGSYMRRKGEDRATKEEFADFRERLCKTTEDTESIKNTLSGKNWLTQQQWTIREKHYVQLLSDLTKLKISLQARNQYFVEPGSEYNTSLEEQPGFLNASSNGSRALSAIDEQIGPAALFLSKKSIASLEKLVRKHCSVAEFSACTVEYVSAALDLVEVAYSAVLFEGKQELGRREEQDSS